MDRDRFKLIHSELIQQVQCIENNLKIIYAAMCKGNFNKNLRVVDEIREIRNYWCHQCYLDFMYIENNFEREKAFQKVATKLHYDEFRTYALFEKTESMRQFITAKYR